MFDLGKIIGHKVTAIKGYRADSRKSRWIEPRYIFFDTDEFFIVLEEQDYYSHHDCSGCARHVEIRTDKNLRRVILENLDGCYPDANSDI